MWQVGTHSSGVITLLIANWQIRVSLKRKVAANTHLSDMLMDIDNFKPINDQYIRQVIESVLKFVADIAGAVLRDWDCLAQVGGDEYRLFLSPTTVEQEKVIAIHIEEKLKQVKVRIDE